MRDLIRDLIPHAPELGLFVEPDIPADRVRAAIRDYAKDLDPGDVLALYDATLLRSAKDGALFTADRFVFQNNDLVAPQTVMYGDIVAVRPEKKLLGGRRVHVDVNRGRATVELTIDFSGKPGAAGPVTRFLSEAMLRETEEERRRSAPEAEDPVTDREAVREALEALVAAGRLTARDLGALLRVLDR